MLTRVSHIDLSIHFFLELALIIAVCRTVGMLAKQLLGQPQVVGEMIAGVLMGPSLFGLYFPELQSAIFPRETIPLIFVISQIGLSTYMFIVGMEFDVRLIRARSAAAVSLAGILVPFALGSVLAWHMWGNTEFFSEKATLFHVVVFLGAAISITAFPMLARIVYERGLSGTPMGTLVLGAGSLDDAAAWCLLALMLAMLKGDMAAALLTIGGGVLYALVTLTIGKKLLAQLGAFVEKKGQAGNNILALIFCLLMACAWITDKIGIYCVFGAFILGAAMPKGRLNKELQAKLEPFTTNILLPLFFIFSGLNTRLGLLNSPQMWTVAAGVLLASCAGKFAACGLAAKLAGSSTRDCLCIGALMNARGLMELILLNIGLQAGVITPALFTILVVMAVVTTVAATPLFELFQSRPAPQTAEAISVPHKKLL